MIVADAVSTITTATTGLGADLLTIGAIGIGVSAGIFALRKGWGLLRSMVKG